jgi:uncharacterized protein YciI
MRLPRHRCTSAHKALWSRFAESGSLLLIAPFSDGNGSMAVFATREAAEEFAKQDPFVAHGVVRGWSIREWHEALLAESQCRIRQRLPWLVAGGVPRGVGLGWNCRRRVM